MIAGVDISHYQTVDFKTLAASDVKFCYIKASEKLVVDPTFNRNWAGVKDAGLIRGAYHFFHPQIAAKAQAEFFLRTVGDYVPGDLPPVLDIEGHEWAQVAPGDRVGMILEFLQAIGPKAGAYLSPGFAKYTLPDGPDKDQLASFSLWVAHYTMGLAPRVPPPWAAWSFWQYSGSGRASGITGPVDLDWFNGTEEELHALVS